jgi:hypothetical protein
MNPRVTATNIGVGFGEPKELPPIEAVPPSPSAVAEQIPPVPPPMVKEDPEAWGETPCIEGQSVRYPKSVRITGVITKIFDLSVVDQLTEYNALNAKATVKTPGVIVHKELIERSKGTDVWHVLFQYRLVQYKKLTPQEAANPLP